MRLDAITRGAKDGGRKSLVAFLTAGYPDEDTFVDVMVAASKAGCDVIEIGIPFSDPIADGPVIQAASTHALAGGMTLTRALELAAANSERLDSALVLMGYINPIMNLGLGEFAQTAARSGISGVILPDVPLEESADMRIAFSKAMLDYIDLLAPTSSDERVAAIAEQATGFLYLVSVTGVTGAGTASASDLGAFVARVRAVTDVPAYVGFGISSPEQAATVCGVADGVIIGSQLIRTIDDGDPASAADRVGSFLTEVRAAID